MCGHCERTRLATSCHHPGSGDCIAEVTTICAGNLAHDVSEQDLRALISPFCEIVSLQLKTDRRGRPKGVATIKLLTDQPEPLLARLRGAEVCGRVLDLWVDGPATGLNRSKRTGRRPRR